MFKKSFRRPLGFFIWCPPWKADQAICSMRSTTLMNFFFFTLHHINSLDEKQKIRDKVGKNYVTRTSSLHVSLSCHQNSPPISLFAFSTRHELVSPFSDRATARTLALPFTKLQKFYRWSWPSSWTPYFYPILERVWIFLCLHLIEIKFPTPF